MRLLYVLACHIDRQLLKPPTHTTLPLNLMNFSDGYNFSLQRLGCSWAPGESWIWSIRLVNVSSGWRTRRAFLWLRSTYYSKVQCVPQELYSLWLPTSLGTANSYWNFHALPSWLLVIWFFTLFLFTYIYKTSDFTCCFISDSCVFWDLIPSRYNACF